VAMVYVELKLEPKVD
jgi:hypothetical protein